MPGGGLRGVIAYVGRFEPTPKDNTGKSVYLIIDLIGVAIEAWSNISRLPI